jgi:hypothetical protein
MVALVLLALVSGAAAPDTGKKEHAGAPTAPKEQLSGWEWYQDVPAPDVSAPQGVKPRGLADFLLTPDVFDKAHEGLADLRLYDSQKREVPYALRTRRRQDTQVLIPGREVNRATTDKGVAEVWIDLGTFEGEHNEIAIDTNGNEFRRAVVIEGSQNDKDEKGWRVLKDKIFLMHFEGGGHTVDVRKFSYPPSRFRYVRLRVSPFVGADDHPQIQAVHVYHSVQTEGEYVTRPATLGYREAVRADGDQPGSAWTITLANGMQMPVEKLSFDIEGDEFDRTYRLEVVPPNEENQGPFPPPRMIVASGHWLRRARDQRKPLEISFSEVTAARLQLIVTDSRNTPLTITSVSGTAAAREVIFTPPEDAAGPLKLYYGNPKAIAPQYEFATGLPTLLEPPPTRVELGLQHKNEEYHPPEKPLTERWPWLVYVVLASASAVLLALLGLLGREAIVRHDASRGHNP